MAQRLPALLGAASGAWAVRLGQEQRVRPVLGAPDLHVLGAARRLPHAEGTCFCARQAPGESEGCQGQVKSPHEMGAPEQENTPTCKM